MALSTITSPRALTIHHKRASMDPPIIFNSTIYLLLHSECSFRQIALPMVLASPNILTTNLRVQATSMEQTLTLNRAQQRSPPSMALSTIVSSRELPIYHQRQARMISRSMVKASMALSTIAIPRALAIHHKRASMPSMVNSTVAYFCARRALKNHPSFDQQIFGLKWQAWSRLCIRCNGAQHQQHCQPFLNNLAQPTQLVDH